jgi:hypothetical protein
MKLIDLILCDDIRMEMGNKTSLMGVYDSSIEFYVSPDKKNTWPKKMKIGIFARLKAEDQKINISRFEFKSILNDKETLIQKGKFNFPPDYKTINMAIIHNAFVFENEGKMEFVLLFYNNKEEVVDTIYPDYTLEIKEIIRK